MKRTNKIISLVVTLAIILSSMIFVVPTAAEEAAPAFESWTVADAGASLSGSGTAEDPYVANLEGSGTEEDPYLIGSEADFIAFIMASNVLNADLKTDGKLDEDKVSASKFAALGVVYKLTADIDLTAKNWAFGNSTFELRATLDGDGHSLAVDFKDPNAPGQGNSLFGTLRRAYIHDIDFMPIWKVTRTSAVTYQGTLAYRSYGAIIENMNAILDIDVVYDAVGSTGGFTGGLIGYATWNGVGMHTEFNNVTFTGSFRIATINTPGNLNSSMKWGGIAGRATGVDFTDCIFDLDIEVNRGRDPLNKQNGTVNRFGGIIGYTEFGGENQAMVFENCVNKSRFNFIDGSNNGGRVGSWLGTDETGSTLKGISLKFINCIDITTWTGTINGTPGTKQPAMIGYHTTGKITAENLIFDGVYAANVKFIGDGHQAFTATNSMVGGFSDAIYQDNGDTIDLYLNLSNWLAISDELYPVYVDATFNGESYVDLNEDYDLNVVILTFEKGDAEEGTLPEIAYYSIETDELFTTQTVEATGVNWTTFRAAEFENGPYVKGQTIEIATANQLALLAYMANTSTTFEGATIKLVDDIDLAGYEWISIGNYHGAGFKGKIDGQGHSIKNMTITGAYTYGVGFIGHTNAPFEIKDVKFIDPVLAPTQVGGSIPGVATVVCSHYGGVIDGVTVEGLDLNIATTSVGYVGGIVGYLGDNTSTLKNSSASGEIYGVAVSDPMIGGLVARPRYGFIDNCVSNVNIDVELGLGYSASKNEVKDENGTLIGTGKAFNVQAVTVGGITGEVNAYVAELTSITNCTNNGHIKVTLTDNATYAWIGGIIGANTTPGIVVIEGCQNNGTITLNNANLEDVTPELGEFDKFASSVATDAENRIGAVIGSNKCSTIINDTTSVVDAEVVGKELNATMIDGLEVLAGARVRIDATNGLTNSGLRFDAKVNKAVYAGIHGKKDSKQGNQVANVTLGMMIVPVEMIGEKTAAELYADENVLKVNLTKGFYNVDSNGEAYYSAAIINLKEANYDREFVAITYMNIQSQWSGAGTVIFGDIDTTNARSAKFVAGKALEDATAGYTSEQIAVLQQYVA